MKKPGRLSILTLLAAIIAALFVIANTHVMAPVMRFVMDTDQGTPLQFAGCIVAAVLGLRFAYVLLNMVGEYYADQLDEIHKKKAVLQGGD